MAQKSIRSGPEHARDCLFLNVYTHSALNPEQVQCHQSIPKLVFTEIYSRGRAYPKRGGNAAPYRLLKPARFFDLKQRGLLKTRIVHRNARPTAAHPLWGSSSRAQPFRSNITGGQNARDPDRAQRPAEVDVGISSQNGTATQRSPLSKRAAPSGPP